MKLSDVQLRQFHEDGFLIVPDFFSRSQFQPVMEWINDLVDDLAEKLFAAGKIHNKHADKGFYTRLTSLEEEFPGAAVLIHIRGLLGPALADLWGSPGLLEVMEQILGPEVAGHPVWNLRLEDPPESSGDRPLAPGHGLPGARSGTYAPTHGLDPAHRRQFHQWDPSGPSRWSSQRPGLSAPAGADSGPGEVLVFVHRRRGSAPGRGGHLRDAIGISPVDQPAHPPPQHGELF